MKLYKAIIYTRGKNRDVYGNPYHAYKAVLTFSYVSYFRDITICQNISWGDSSERDCLDWALQGIKEALGIDLEANDERITHHHKHVYSDRELRYPENWKV